MLSKKSQLVRQVTWNANRRYKIGTVVLYSDVEYQNITGKNSIPGTDDNWLSMSGASTIPSRILYINSITGNNTTAIPGDANFPFINTTGAFSIMDSNINVKYTIVYLNNVNHAMPMIPNRNIEFIGEIDDGDSGLTGLDFTATVPVSGSVIMASNVYFNTLKFTNIKLYSNSSTAKGLTSQSTHIEIENCDVDWLTSSASNLIFNVLSFSGYFRNVPLKAGNFFCKTDLNKLNVISIYNLIVPPTGGAVLTQEANNLDINILNITGSGGSASLIISNGSNNSVFRFNSISINAVMTIVGNASTSNKYVFNNTTIGNNSSVSIGNGGGEFIGSLSAANVRGLESEFEGGGFTTKFINFIGRLSNFNKYSSTSIFEFYNCNLITSGALINLQSATYTANSIKFIGVNTIKQDTPTYLLDNIGNATTTIEKRSQDAISTNATSLDSDGTITVVNTTPNTY